MCRGKKKSLGTPTSVVVAVAAVEAATVAFDAATASVAS